MSLRLIPMVLALSLLLPAAWAGNTAAADKDLKEVADFQLELSTVQKLTAVAQDLQAYEKAHPQANQPVSRDPGDNKTIDATVARVQKNSPLMAILDKHSVTPRQYVVGMMCVLQTAIAAVAVVQGGDQTWADLKRQGINTDNVHFYLEHKAEMDLLTKATSGQPKKDEEDEDDDDDDGP